MPSYNLPSTREITSDIETYVAAWESLVKPVLNKFGWELVAFNPNYVLSTKDGVHFILPVDVVQAISDLVRNPSSPYQRGNRDGLLSFAAWAREMAEVCRAEADRRTELQMRSLDTRIVEQAGRLVGTMLWQVDAYKRAAQEAERMAEALPLDPEGPEISHEQG